MSGGILIIGVISLQVEFRRNLNFLFITNDLNEASQLKSLIGLPHNLANNFGSLIQVGFILEQNNVKATAFINKCYVVLNIEQPQPQARPLQTEHVTLVTYQQKSHLHHGGKLPVSYG